MALFGTTKSSVASTAGGVISVVAPTIATALGGPLAGMAVRAISNMFFGHNNGTWDDVQAALAGASPDQLTQLKKIDADFKVQMEQLNIDLERIAADDRASAREMQAANKDWIPRVLAICVTLGFFGILISMSVRGLPVSGGEAFLLLLGALTTSFNSIIAFYYGSSSGSRAKDDIINNLKGK